jgi:hypothetical protein
MLILAINEYLQPILLVCLNAFLCSNSIASKQKKKIANVEFHGGFSCPNLLFV